MTSAKDWARNSGTSLAHRAQEHADAGRHEQASLHFMAAAQQFRADGSHAAAASMDKAAAGSAAKAAKAKKGEQKLSGQGGDLARDDQGRFASK